VIITLSFGAVHKRCPLSGGGVLSIADIFQTKGQERLEGLICTDAN